MAVTTLAIQETVVGPLKQLANRAPEIIHELNPVNWIRDCLNDSRSFRLAKLKIQSETAINLQQRDIILKEISAVEKIYIESQKNALKVLHEQQSVFFSELKSNEKSLNNAYAELDYYSKQLFSENIDQELRHMVFSCIQEIRKEIHSTLNRIRDAASQQSTILQSQLDAALEAQKNNHLPSGNFNRIKELGEG